MSGERMVERRQSVAVSDSSALQHYPTGDSSEVEVFSARSRNFHLSARDGLSNLHLAEKDANDLAYMYPRHAHRDRAHDGNVPFRADHDRA